MLTFRTTLLFHFLIQALPQLVGCKDWTATLPGSLRAVRDSCLVIPCMFRYPGQPKPRSDLAGIWYQEDAIFYHSANPAFQDRAQLVGDLGAQNCSLWIKRIRSEDAKTYKFRVEIQSLDKFTFHAQVTVYVEDTPNILPESDCKFRRQLFECSCVVQSNPSPFIRWHLPDRNLSAADGEFSFHSSVAGHMTRSHLKGTASFETSITCSASNSEGVAQLVLPNHADTMWNLLASVLPSGFLVLAITAAAAACRHQRTKVAQAGEKPKDITPKKVPNEDVLKNAPVDGPGSVDLYANVLSSADCKEKGNTIDSNIMYLEGLYQMVLPARDQDSVYHNC